MRPAALSLHRPLDGAVGRIVAFPHAGGGASAFHALRACLGRHRIDLCPLQPPARENRTGDAPAPSLTALAAEFAAAVAALPPLPTAFLGHSLGGLTAYLTARRLFGEGRGPDHLVVSASLPPDLRRTGGGLADAPDFRARIVAMGGIPAPVLASPELMDLFEATIRADIRLIERHVHADGPPLSCPITVYAGDADAGAPPAAMRGWAALTDRPLRRRVLSGGHFFLYADPDTTAAFLLDDLGWTVPRAVAARPDADAVVPADAESPFSIS